MKFFFILCLAGDQCLEADICQFNWTHKTYYCDEKHCIPKFLLCNGIPNCPMAQDETISECGKMLKIHKTI